MKLSLNYIRQLASASEGVDVEFKETTGQLNRGMETLCGMMNGNGGIVVFGVTNKGKIIGQDKGDKTTREIGEALRKFDPAVDIQPDYIEIEDTGKFLIAFQTDGQEPDKPFLWDGKPYIRHDSVTSVMPREKFVRLHELQHGLIYKWENEVNATLKIEDLDERLIMNVVHGAVRRGRLSNDALNDSVSTLLTRLNLVKNGSVCNSAAVLFGKDFPITLNADCVLPGSKELINNISSTISSMSATSSSWWILQWHSFQAPQSFRHDTPQNNSRG